MSLFCTLLRGTVPPTTALRDPIGVDWGLRRLQHNGSETRLTLWALSAAEAFSELRADLCSQSHTIVLVLDAESARLSEQLQQLKRLLQSAQLHLQPGQNPALFLVAAGGQGCVWAKAAAECRRFAAVHHCRFLEVQPLSTAGTESLLHLLASSNLRLVEAEE
ncbi:hypothetical protein, conserved [Eimeria maxima]|uniref:Uncharacterized protein n=1 Tax=Eimeria maxima TaxID=5804 RepID=U6MAV2_EIMMA|nr:hypothetical protein, conserved [Eimeria maxima]CDJ60178.1 hypothetical protein, conserved [Eimeria maxima]